jgi:hypothetical protein
MSDEPTTPEGEGKTTEPEAQSDVEKQAFLDRLGKESAKRKEAEKRATDIEKSLAELKAQMEERESAGLPELERERKRAEQLEKRAAEAERKAEEATKAVARGQRERWVTTAAQALNFADPSDAVAFVNLDDIEDEADAHRKAKRVASEKKHLLKAEEPTLPGRVLKDGRTSTDQPKDAATNMRDEAQYVSDALVQFRKSRAAAA